MALSGASSLNGRGARTHVVSDLLVSGAATGAALLILALGMDADARGWLATCLLQGMPSKLDLAAIEAELHGVAGVEAIYHLRAGLRWRRLPSGKQQHMSGSGEIGADKGLAIRRRGGLRVLLAINTLVFGVILFAG